MALFRADIMDEDTDDFERSVAGYLKPADSRKLGGYRRGTKQTDIVQRPSKAFPQLGPKRLFVPTAL